MWVRPEFSAWVTQIPIKGGSTGNRCLPATTLYVHSTKHQCQWSIWKQCTVCLSPNIMTTSFWLPSWGSGSPNSKLYKCQLVTLMSNLGLVHSTFDNIMYRSITDFKCLTTTMIFHLYFQNLIKIRLLLFALGQKNQWTIVRMYKTRFPKLWLNPFMSRKRARSPGVITQSKKEKQGIESEMSTPNDILIN